MEVQLQDLVEKIRKDGVENAEAKAAEIIGDAQTKAAAIVKAARDEADAIVKNGETEAARFEKASVSAIQQAGRNLLLSFRDCLVSELDAIVRDETARAYDAGVLAELVPAVVKAWASKTDADDIAVLLSPADATKLESGLKTALKAEISKGLEIRGDASFVGGFRIGLRDGSAFYDFSAEAVSDLFAAYLNPRVAEILKTAAKEL